MSLGIIAVVGVGIAAVAAAAAWRAACQSRNMLRAQAILKITDAYASEEMRTDMTKIKSWKEENKDDDIGKKFVKLRETDSSKFNKIDSARRHITHHFHQIYLLKENNLINDELVKSVVDRDKINFLIGYIEPLENTIDSNYNKKMFIYFKKLLT